MSFYLSIAEAYDDIFPTNAAQIGFVHSALGTAARVLDVGCGTGTLAMALAERGRVCLGIDLEPAMIERAAHKARQAGVSARFEVGDMERVGAAWPAPRCEAIVCVGNTLVHLPAEQVSLALQGFAEHLLPGGRFVVQILNYDRILDQRIAELPLIDNERVTFVRTYGFENLPARLDFSTRLLLKATGEHRENTETLVPLRPNELANLVRASGFTDVALWGGFDHSPLTGSSYACVLTATR